MTNLEMRKRWIEHMQNNGELPENHRKFIELSEQLLENNRLCMMSSGLDANQFIYFDGAEFKYEDNCYLETTPEGLFLVLRDDLTVWTKPNGERQSWFAKATWWTRELTDEEYKELVIKNKEKRKQERVNKVLEA